jgi:hypothetical protein
MKRLVLMLAIVILAGWIVQLNDGTVYKGKEIRSVPDYSPGISRDQKITLTMPNGAEIMLPWSTIKSVTRDDGGQK